MIESRGRYCGGVWKRKRCRAAYIRVIKDMYEGGRTRVRTPGEVSNDFAVSMGLHKGSALSSFPFTLVLDELTRGIQDEVP